MTELEKSKTKNPIRHILKLDRDEFEYLITLLKKPQKGKCYLCRTSILYKLTGSYK